MLTSLDFLKIGQPWPPKDEDTKERLNMYAENKKLFENKHSDVYKKAFQRIERIINNFGDVISYPVIINYQKLMSLKVADLLLGEPPIINAGDVESKEQKAIDKIIENSDLINTAYMNAIDVSRYGDGLFYIYKNNEKGIIDITQPSVWFPVVKPENIRIITHHVLARVYSKADGKKKNFYLNAQIHSIGKYEEYTFLLKPGGDEKNPSFKIQSVEEGPKIVSTNLDDFAIIQVPNTLTSDRITGLDDYTDVDSIISDILVRIGQIDRILDKHANPTVEGPISALEKDPVTGEWKLKMGGYIPRESSEEPETRYITWEGQLESSFKQIEILINQLYAVSEMGSAIFDISKKTGQVPSGSALRRLMVNALAKVNRIRMRFDPAFKKAIKLCSKLGGEEIVDLSKVPISIKWQDGLPGDPVEESDIMQKRVGSATMSKERALKTYDGLSDKDIEIEVEKILSDESFNNPFASGTDNINNTPNE